VSESKDGYIIGVLEDNLDETLHLIPLCGSLCGKLDTHPKAGMRYLHDPHRSKLEVLGSN
jgi:hypothetical protein